MKAKSQALVKEAIRLVKDGLSTHEAATQLGINQSTVSRMLARNKENVPINRGGRPRKLQPENVEYVKLNLKRGVFKTAVEATKAVNGILKEPVSAETVRRRLKEAGLLAKKIVKRPALRKRHVQARLDFVKKYKEWTEEDWALVVWSDESKINRFCSDGIRYVWDDQPGRLNDRTVQGTVKFGGGSVMVWSCMSWYGPGYIAKIDQSLDAQLYIEILKEDLKMSVDEWGLAKDEFIFQHDNDPKHTAKVTKAYLESVGMTEQDGKLLFWPAQSPDLNPIEHMWAYLKIQLGKNYQKPPGSCKELWERISVEWYKIPQEFCRQLIRSMPRRLQAVHRAKGKHTKY